MIPANLPNAEKQLMSTPHSEFDDIVRRLEKLEIQNRRLKLLGFALAICCTVGLISAAEPARDKSGEFEQFVLRDKAGKQRAKFDVGRDGPSLHFFDDDGRDFGGLSGSVGGLFLRLNNREGKLQTGINLNQAGVVVVSYGSSGRLLSGTMAIQETTGGFTK
jgi:hypothetical protein